jgi:hypothetical protein
VTGVEAFTISHDVCGLEPDQAIAVAHWAAQTLLTAGLHDSPNPERDPQISGVADKTPAKWTPLAL